MNIPTLQNYSEWVQASDRLQALRIELSETEELIQHGMDQRRKQDRLDQDALSFLDGGAPKQTTINESKIEELSEHRKLLKRAIDIQVQRINALESSISAEICKKTLQPAYTKLIQEIVPVVAKLQSLVEQEGVFRNAMNDAGVRFSPHIKICYLNDFGKKDDAYSPLNRFLADAVECGHVKQSEVEALQR